MKVYHDWEFLEDGKTITPISVGMVAENGDELYLINRYAPWGLIKNHEFLKKEVLPELPFYHGVTDFDPTYDFDPDHKDFKNLRSPVEMAVEVRDFLMHHYGPNGIELWAWYGAFDHICLAWLFGPMNLMPDGIPYWTNDIRQEHYRLGEPKMPKQAGTKHNALADARHNKVMHEFLIKLENGE